MIKVNDEIVKAKERCGKEIKGEYNRMRIN